MTGPTLGLVCCSAGGVEQVRERLIEPLLQKGWQVAVTLTPTASRWLKAIGEVEKIEGVTGLPVRDEPRLPSEDSPHPPVDCYAVAPATANTVAKIALGIADNQALTQVCEAIGASSPPVIVFPRINAAHAAQPAWNDHITRLRAAKVRLLYGDEIWPLHTPRSAPNRELPWAEILWSILNAVDHKS